MAKHTLEFSDETIVPDDELIWKQTMSYLNDNNNNITEVWKFYKDGKSWLFRTTKKKKTVFWIRILNDTFRIAFWFAIKLEPIILESKLPQTIKEDYLKAKIFNKSRSIHIDVRDSLDFEIIKTLIDLKTENL